MAPTLTFPPAAVIEILDGSNWSTWSSRITAILRMNGLRGHITDDLTTPAAPDWTAAEELLLGTLEVYTQKDVWTAVSDDIKFNTVKKKWVELKRIYGGVGSMSAFNTWTALTGTCLDESSPMLPQLQKLNEARVSLQNNDMPISDLQFSFILIKALPDSFSAVASTILATGAPSDLKPQTIQDRILNEEGRRAGGSASLNKIAPVKKKKDKSEITCFYCKKSGHKSNECRKKKRDLEEKEKKEKEKAGQAQTTNKAVNAHIQVVPSTATITEITDDNDEIRVSLYTAARSRWMVDSGATHHITPYRSDFVTWTPAKGTVSLGGHAEIAQIGIGTVIVKTIGGDRTSQLTLHNVMHVPDAQARYFSVGALLSKGGRIAFGERKFEILIDNRKIAQGYLADNLFWLDTSNPAIHAHTSTSTPIEIWHQHMGHLSYNALMRHSASVKGMSFSAPISDDQSLCPGCELGKQTRLPFSASSKRSDRRLAIVHSDLAGPMEIKSIHGALYIATFIDDYSRFGVVYFLKRKDQCAAAFQKYLAWAENQTSDRMLALHSDRGGEYISGALKSILDEKGIDHKLTMPGSPQQNGLAERWNRTILDKARSMLHSSGLSKGFWELAIDTAVHTYNRSPSRIVGWKTPHELWSDGHIPDVSYLRVFGSKAYVHTPEAKRKKLDPRSIEMIFVGYEPGSKGYRFWNSSKRSIVLSRDVTFDERTFPAKLAAGPPAPAPAQPLMIEGSTTIMLPQSTQTVPAPPHTPQIVPTPDRQSTIFHTPPSQPAASPPARAHVA
jgi:Integrase core domain/gag-polypeptide of LTR copia-type/GAG-pre-integrase domain